MTDLAIPARGAAGGPGGYSDQINALLATIGDPLPVLVQSIDGGTTSDQANLNAAITLAGAERRALCLVGRLRFSLDTLIPESIPEVLFGVGAMLAPDASVGVTIESVFDPPKSRHVFDLAAGGSAIVAPQIGDWWARWFGARGNNQPGDETFNDLAFLAMLATAIGSGRDANAHIGGGHFRHSTSLVFGSPNNGISLLGVLESTHEQGSAESDCILDYFGTTAVPQIDDGGFVHIAGVAGQNHGNATQFIKTNAASGRGAERAHLSRITTEVVTGANLWSDVPIYLQEFNYAEIEHWECTQGPGLRLGPYGTSVDITGKSVLDPASTPGGGARAFIVVDEGFGGTVVNIQPGVTFNGEAGCGTLWDNWDSDGDPGTLNLWADDLTTNVSGSAQPPLVKARNLQVSLKGSKVHQFNDLADNLILLRNSKCFVAEITGESISLPIVRGADLAGEQSYVYAGPCPDLTPANTRGIHDGDESSAFDGSLIPITPVAGVAHIPLNLLSEGGIAKVTASGAVEIVFDLPSDSVQGFWRYGQLVVVELVNVSGGALTPTYEAFIHHRGAAPAAIPNGQSIDVLYQVRGSHASPAVTEIIRSAVG